MTPSPLKSVLPRRAFLKTGALSALMLAGGLGAPGTTSALARPQNKRRKPTNVIFMVSDGMSAGTLTMADQFKVWREGKASHWRMAYERASAGCGLMDMSSRSSIVTDSAAASSSWGCGHRVNNGSINMSPEGRPHEPILHLAKQAGRKTGLVTTAKITHATPAGFAANLPDRGEEVLIADQYLERQYDVLLGGGVEFFCPGHRADGRDLVAEFTAGGHRVVRDAAALKALPDNADRVLGLFSENHLPFEVDRLNDPLLREQVPSLAEMTSRALKALSREGEGFIVQIEGARVDHAAHNNDAAGLLYDQLAFDDAIAVALEFQERNPDTLVIITTDHGNANPGINAAGGDDGGEKTFAHIQRFTGSYGRLGLTKEMTPNEIRSRFAEILGIDLSRAHANLLQASLGGERAMPYRRMNQLNSVIGQVLANHTEIGWVGRSHTSDYVQLLALGPGSEKIRGFNRNTDLFPIMARALALQIAG
ncbi:MAG: alkaline phosphatase [Opitutales bacterium]|nr:alkaline phosphatase [Opitutales bacterium]